MSPQKKTKKTNRKEAPEAVPQAEQSLLDLGALFAEIEARLEGIGQGSNDPASLAAQPIIETRQILVFKASETSCALDISYVAEIVRDPILTHVPGLPAWVLGVTSHHGEVISVVDLSRFLGLPARTTANSGMIVATAGDQMIGMMVDEIGIMVTFPAEQIQSPPSRMASEMVAFLSGVLHRGDELVRLLDGERLLLGSEMQQFS